MGMLFMGAHKKDFIEMPEAEQLKNAASSH